MGEFLRSTAKSKLNKPGGDQSSVVVGGAGRAAGTACAARSGAPARAHLATNLRTTRLRAYWPKVVLWLGTDSLTPVSFLVYWMLAEARLMFGRQGTSYDRLILYFYRVYDLFSRWHHSQEQNLRFCIRKRWYLVVCKLVGGLRVCLSVLCLVRRQHLLAVKKLWLSEPSFQRV